MKSVFLSSVVLMTIMITTSSGYSDICANKSDGATFKHPDSDELFFICVNRNTLVLICRENHYYVEKFGTCLLRDESIDVPVEDNNPCENILGTEAIPSERGCQYFYFCQNGIPLAGYCPGGHLFDPIRRICAQAETVDCDLTTTTTAAETTESTTDQETSTETDSTTIKISTTETTELSETTSELFTTTTPEETTTTNESSMINETTEIEMTTTIKPTIEGICYGLPDGTLLYDADFCDRFFLCLFNMSIPSTCPAPKYFNPSSGECDSPENVDCGDEITTTVGPSMCDGFSDGQLLNNYESCSHFYICINNEPLVGKCPLGLSFDMENQKCSSSDLVDCLNPTTTTTDEPTTTTEEPFNDVCIGKPDGALVNNPISCDAFYFCSRETPISGSCPPPSLFNPAFGICDRPENVDCFDETTVSYETTTEVIDVCYIEEDFTFLNDPRTCEGYFLCFNGQSISLTCPEGMYFDPSILICQNSEIVNCNGEETTTTVESTTTAEESTSTTVEITTTTEEITSTTAESTTTTDETSTTPEITTVSTTTERPIPETCPSTGVQAIPNPDRCSRFRLCASGLEIELVCPAGQHFVFETEQCLPRANANCTIPVPVCDPIASSGRYIFLHHPQYCELFFSCLDGHMTPQQCNTGLHFDLVSGECTTQEIANCEAL